MYERFLMKLQITSGERVQEY